MGIKDPHNRIWPPLQELVHNEATKAAAPPSHRIHGVFTEVLGKRHRLQPQDLIPYSILYAGLRKGENQRLLLTLSPPSFVSKALQEENCQDECRVTEDERSDPHATILFIAVNFGLFPRGALVCIIGRLV